MQKEALKKIYEDGYVTLEPEEWSLLHNSLLEYSRNPWNDIIAEKIQDLRGKILMLYAKDNPKIVCSNKKLKKFKEDIFK